MFLYLYRGSGWGHGGMDEDFIVGRRWRISVIIVVNPLFMRGFRSLIINRTPKQSVPEKHSYLRQILGSQ